MNMSMEEQSMEEQTVSEQATAAAEAAEVPTDNPFEEPAPGAQLPEVTVDAETIQTVLTYEQELEAARERLEEASRSLPPSVAREPAQEIVEREAEVRRWQSRIENAEVPTEELTEAITSLPLEVEDLRYQVRDLEAQGRIERAKVVQAELDQRIRIEAAARQELQFRRDEAVQAQTIQRNREDAALRAYQSEMAEAVKLSEQTLSGLQGADRLEMEARIQRLRDRAETLDFATLREDPVYQRHLEQMPEDVLPQSALRIVTGRDGRPTYVDPTPLPPRQAPEPELTPVEKAQADVRAAFQSGDEAAFEAAMVALAKVKNGG